MSRIVIRLFQALQLLYVPELMRIRSGMELWGLWTSRNSSNSNSSNSYYFGGSSDDTTSSSTYPFYVTLDSSDGLMLGQHVYIEMDEGQEERRLASGLGIIIL